MANTVQIIIQGTNRADKAFQQAKTGMIGLEKVAKTAALAFAAFAVAGVAKAGEALVNYTREAINTADEMGKLAQKAGIAVEDFSRLSFATKLAEVDSGTFQTAMRGLSDELVKTGRGSANITDEILRVADQFAAAEDGAAKTTLAVKTFGRAGQEMIPFLNQGSEAIREQMKEAERLRLVIGAQFAANADRFNDNMEKIKLSFKGVSLEIAERALPNLNRWTEALLKLTQDKDLVKGFFDGVIAYAKFVNPFLKLMPQWLDKFADSMGVAKDASNRAGGLFNPEHVEQARKMLAQFEREKLDGYKRLDAEEKHRFKTQIDNINKLQIAEIEKDKLIEEAQKAHWAKMNELKKSGELLRADLDAAFRQGDVERFKGSLQVFEQSEAASLERRQQLMREFQAVRAQLGQEDFNRQMSELQAIQGLQQTHESLMNASILRLKTALLNFAGQASRAISDGIGSAIANIATGAQKASEAFKQLGTQLLGMLVKFAAQLVINAVLGKVLNATITKAASASAVSLAGSWGAAATAASIATLGGATLAGAAVPPLMAINAKLGAGIAAGFGGAAHGGLDYVPRETTYLLDKGERVLSPNQNQDFTEYMERGRMTKIEFILDGSVLGHALAEMSRDGRLTIDSKAIV